MSFWSQYSHYPINTSSCIICVSFWRHLIWCVSCRITNTEFSQQHYHSCLSSTWIFSRRHITALLHVGTLDSTSTPWVGPFWTVKSTTKPKITLVHSMRADTTVQSVTLLDRSWEYDIGWLTFLATLCMSTNAHKSTLGIDLEITNVSA